MKNRSAIERFQFRRAASDGEPFGQMMEIHPLTDEGFRTYIRPRLANPATDMTAYLIENPAVTHYAIIKRHGENEWIYSGCGSLDALRPRSTEAIAVESFGSPKAINFGLL